LFFFFFSSFLSSLFSLLCCSFPFFLFFFPKKKTRQQKRERTLPLFPLFFLSPFFLCCFPFPFTRGPLCWGPPILFNPPKNTLSPQVISKGFPFKPLLPPAIFISSLSLPHTKGALWEGSQTRHPQLS